MAVRPSHDRAVGSFEDRDRPEPEIPPLSSPGIRGQFSRCLSLLNQRPITLLLNPRQRRLLLPIPQPIQLLKAHNQRPPPIRINPILVSLEPQPIQHVCPQHADLDRKREALELARQIRHHLVRPHHLRFHLDLALLDPRRGHERRGTGMQPRDAEFVLDEAVAERGFEGGRVGRAGRARERVDRPDHVVRGQVQHALPGSEQVDSGLGAGGEAEHAAVAEPEGRGHGADVGRAVGVGCGDEDDGGAPVEDGGEDDGMRGCWGWAAVDVSRSVKPDCGHNPPVNLGYVPA
ncbi:hypothetical protein M8818_002132 [Zalaria obscura]|uniref:Uncharacterized protein n=1 Tax=Zalaria obscura TaxID=2024903 RepID=A0ACC3SIC5_9PEZI